MTNAKQFKGNKISQKPVSKTGKGSGKKPLSKTEKLEKIQKVAKVAVKVATDPLVHEILKGIFNDDNDYVFNGYKPQLAANDTRPMDYVSLDQFIDNVLQGGVPDISKLNMAFDVSHIIDSEIMQISSDRVMAELRESLRSNLIEESQDVTNYLLAVLTLQVRIAQYTRALSTAKQTNGTNVHFNDVINSVGDPYSTTFTSAYRPDWTNPDSTIYADNAEALPLVEGLVNRLLVPVKYKNWINWYFNSIFVDQGGLHKQWYVNDVRQLAKFDITGYLGATQMVFKGSEDFFKPNGNPLDDIRQLAIAIYAKYSILIADITKSNISDKFSRMTLSDATRVLEDKSYFQYLINTYATSKENLSQFMSEHGWQLPYDINEYYSGEIKTGFIRYDAIDGVEKDKLGPIQGLAAIATPKGAVAPTIIWPISQSTVVYLPDSMETADYQTATVGQYPQMRTVAEGIYSIALYSFMRGDTNVNSSGTSVSVYGTPGDRISLQSAMSKDTVTILTTNSTFARSFTYGQAFTFIISDISQTQQTCPYSTEVAYMRGRINSPVVGYGVFRINPSELVYDGKKHELSLSVPESGDEGLRIAGRQFPFASRPSGNFYVTYIAHKTGAQTGLITIYNTGTGGGGGPLTMTLEDSQESELYPLFFEDHSVVIEYYGDAWYKWSVDVEVQGSVTTTVTNSATNHMHFITDRFDYSIPVYYVHNIRYGTVALQQKGLIKETYNPQLLELNSVKTTMEQMFLGLMSII